VAQSGNRSGNQGEARSGAEPGCPPNEPRNPAPAGANEESPLNMHSNAERAARILPSAIALEDASVFGQGVSGRGVGACRAHLKRFG
jgi:hypothetical protein